MLKPPADAYDFKPVKGARIEMTVDGRTSVLKGAKTADGLTDDDACGLPTASTSDASAA